MGRKSVPRSSFTEAGAITPSGVIAGSYFTPPTGDSMALFYATAFSPLMFRALFLPSLAGSTPAIPVSCNTVGHQQGSQRSRKLTKTHRNLSETSSFHPFLDSESIMRGQDGQWQTHSFRGYSVKRSAAAMRGR